MTISNIYNRLALSSPYVEMMLRRFYWRYVGTLKRFNPNKATSVSKESNISTVNFDKIIEWLRTQGIGDGSLLIIHSGYGELERTGLSPDQLIDKLLELVGVNGTIAMPVIRRYKDLEKARKSGSNIHELKFVYNVKKTMVTSGLLPYTLMRRENAVTSHHPFNPLCAIGPLAHEMMLHNLEGDAPSPHGPYSSWKFCLDHGAKVCSIGTDIEHHNTIMHVVEEAFGDWYWPENVWYDCLHFEIVDENKQSNEFVVKNRKEEWGKLHIAEINVCHAEKRAGAMISDNIDGVTVGFVDPPKMVELLRKKNKKGYPYFVYPWENVNKIK